MKAKKVDISVIVPTYRRPHLVKRCLEALLAQQVEVPFEIIIVIDGPTEEIELPSHSKLDDVRIITMGKNSGPASARNHGFRHAQGELIVFTDDDCIPHNEFLSSYWRAYARTQTSNVAFTGKVKVPLNGEPSDYERNIKQLESAEFITANCAVTRNAFTKVGGFDETYTMAWREDSDLHFSLLDHGVPVMHVPQAVVHHPVREAKWNVSLQSEKKNMFNALLYKKFPLQYQSRIRSKPPLSYYVMITLLPIALIATFMIPYLSIMIWLMWITLVLNFTMSRACRSSSGMLVMFVTSAAIPFLSVYWNIYGNIKFKSKLI